MISRFKLDIKQSTQPINIKLRTEQCDRIIQESLMYVEQVPEGKITGMLIKNYYLREIMRSINLYENKLIFNPYHEFYSHLIKPCSWVVFPQRQIEVKV